MRLLKPMLSTKPVIVEVDQQETNPSWLVVHQPDDPYRFRLYPPMAQLRNGGDPENLSVVLDEELYEKTIASLGHYNHRFGRAKFHTQAVWETETHGKVNLFLVTTPNGIELTGDLFHFNLPAIKDKFALVTFYKLTDPCLLRGFEMHYCSSLERETAWLVVVPDDSTVEYNLSHLSGDLKMLLDDILRKRIATLGRMIDGLVANGEGKTKQYVRLSRIRRTLAKSQNSKPVRAALLNAVLASLPSSLPGMYLYQILLDLKSRLQLDVDCSAVWGLFDPALGRKQFYQRMVETKVISLETQRERGLLFEEDV